MKQLTLFHPEPTPVNFPPEVGVALGPRENDQVRKKTGRPKKPPPNTSLMRRSDLLTALEVAGKLVDLEKKRVELKKSRVELKTSRVELKTKRAGHRTIQIKLALIVVGAIVGPTSAVALVLRLLGLL